MARLCGILIWPGPVVEIGLGDCIFKVRDSASQYATGEQKGIDIL